MASKSWASELRSSCSMHSLPAFISTPMSGPLVVFLARLQPEKGGAPDVQDEADLLRGQTLRFEEPNLVLDQSEHIFLFGRPRRQPSHQPRYVVMAGRSLRLPISCLRFVFAHICGPHGVA